MSARCEVCGATLRYHEREAHPQVYCYSCAEVHGVARLCDVASPDAARISERVVEEILRERSDADGAAVDAVIRRAAAADLAELGQVAAVLRGLGPLAGSDIVVLTFGGQHIPEDVVTDLVAESVGADPERVARPFVVVPNGWLGRAHRAAMNEGLEALATWLLEAPRVAEFGAVTYVSRYLSQLEDRAKFLEKEEGEVSAAEVAFFRWFMRDSITDDDVIEILAEQGETGDFVQEVIAGRAMMREQHPLSPSGTYPGEGTVK